jgi:hypothetical protein
VGNVRRVWRRALAHFRDATELPHLETVCKGGKGGTQPTPLRL